MKLVSKHLTAVLTAEKDDFVEEAEEFANLTQSMAEGKVSCEPALLAQMKDIGVVLEPGKLCVFGCK